MKLTHISYSQITEFLACPYRWWVTKVEGIRQPPSIPMNKGILVHEALDRYTRQYLLTREHSDELMSNIWKETNCDISIVTNALPLADYEDGRNMLCSLIERSGLDLSGTLLAEESFEFSVNSAKLKGRVDRVDYADGYYRIVDYKSGFEMPNTDKVDTHLELSLYAVALADYICPATAYAEPINVAIHNVRYNRIVDTWRTPEQIQETREFIEVMWQKMSAVEHCEPIVCDACTKYNGCWLSHRCDAHKIIFNIGDCELDLNNMSEDEIQEKINTLELWLKQLKKKVKPPMKRNVKQYKINKKEVKELNKCLIEHGYIGFVDITEDNALKVYDDIKTFFCVLLTPEDNEFIMNYIGGMFENWGVKIG